MLMIAAWSLNFYENHFYANRTTDKETGNKEFEIAVNGSSLAHCETFVIEAMNLYWKVKLRDRIGEWHFFKTLVLEKPKPSQENSEMLERILSIGLESVQLFFIV